MTRPSPQPDSCFPLRVRRLGRRAYVPVFEAMRDYTNQRGPDSPDELWLVEHEPVFTQGLAGRPEHLLRNDHIPVVQSDRGGQVTYHGPGQLVCYPLLDLERRRLGIRCLVDRLEQCVIEVLGGYGLQAGRRAHMPGVYLGEDKIASIGLKVRRGRCYHGLALNLAMDLTPFAMINPCGYAGLRMTQLADWVTEVDPDLVAVEMVSAFCRLLDYHASEELYRPVEKTNV